MTQDEMIEMARQAGFAEPERIISTDTVRCVPDLAYFAELVAEKEREAWERKFARLQSLMDLRETQPNKPCCLAEREACAKIADNWAVGYPHPSTVIAETIRARGQA
jgi:hypothetical protein